MTAGVTSFVLDSFALRAFFQAEPGGPRVRQLMEQAVQGEASLAITTVNLGDVAYRTERQYDLEWAQEVMARIEEYPLAVVDVDRELALGAAHLKARYRMAYADCLAVSLARHLSAMLATGDPEFRQVEGPLATIEWMRAAGAA